MRACRTVLSPDLPLCPPLSRIRPRARGGAGPARCPASTTCPRLGRWLRDNGILPVAAPPAVRLIAGGRSNLTYLVDGRAAAGPDAPLLVLRRPPLGHVLPTAHDMGREYQVLSALRGTAVPVPPVAGKVHRPGGDRRPVLRHGVRARAGAAHRGGRRAGQPGPGPPAVGELRGHAGRHPRRGSGRGRAERLRPAGRLYGAAAGPLAAAVGAVQHPGDAWLRRAHQAAGRGPAGRDGRRGSRDPGARRLPAGQHAGHARRPAVDRGRAGLGDVHPGRPTGRPRPGPRLLGRAG